MHLYLFFCISNMLSKTDFQVTLKALSGIFVCLETSEICMCVLVFVCYIHHLVINIVTFLFPNLFSFDWKRKER